MNPGAALFGLLVFPGLLYAVPMGWLMLGSERRLRARFQGRLGPPLWQPCLDFVKLLAKSPVARAAADTRMLAATAVLAVASLAGALPLLPVWSGRGGFAGDLILLAALIEVPPLCLIVSGYASRSIYGEVGASREALIGVVANVPFLAALAAMAVSSGSLHLSEIGSNTPWTVRIPALLAVLLCLPVKLRMNPFSLSNAEQEVLAGPLTELDGARLALWELAHALEWVVLAGLVVTLGGPYRTGHAVLDAIVFSLLSVAVLGAVTLLAASTARLKVAQAARLLLYTAFTCAAMAMAVTGDL